ATLSDALAALARDINATNDGVNTHKRIVGLRDILNNAAEIMQRK
ncbi:MAG: hypothetical protein ACJAYN_002386, partial [Bermanella sp.]